MSKSKPSKNALSHGFYANDVVLPGENQQEFDNLLRAYCDEFCPQGPSAEATVFDLVSLHWKKRRLEAGFQKSLHKADASSDDWDLIADEARAVAKSQLKAAQLACNEIFKHMERVFKPDEAKADSEVVELEKLTTFTKELNIVSEFIIPTLHAAEKQKLDQIERHPDIMEKQLRIQTAIDRQIEKALKRLVFIEEYKRLYVQTRWRKVSRDRSAACNTDQRFREDRP